jgi:hypothetical protein
MRLVRSCRRVKKGKDLGKRRRDEDDMAAFWGGSKEIEYSGNKMRVNRVSSIAFP